VAISLANTIASLLILFPGAPSRKELDFCTFAELSRRSVHHFYGSGSHKSKRDRRKFWWSIFPFLHPSLLPRLLVLFYGGLYSAVDETRTKRDGKGGPERWYSSSERSSTFTGVSRPRYFDQVRIRRPRKPVRPHYPGQARWKVNRYPEITCCGYHRLADVCIAICVSSAAQR